MTLEEKISLIENIYVETAKITEVMADIEEAILVGRASNYASQPICTLVMGLSGVGKTSLREHFEKKYPRSVHRDEEKEQSVVPILSTTLTDDKNSKAAPGKMLRDLGDALKGSKGNRAELGDRFTNQIISAKTQAIFIDEFQHAFEGGTEARMGNAVNWIKTLINQTKRPVVLFGMPWCTEILDRSSELQNRFDNIHYLDEYDVEVDSFADWLKLLEKIEQQLPFEKASNLANDEFALRLLVLTGGNISRLMKKLIKPAARRAAMSGEECIGLHQLLAAAKKHLSVPEEYNPLSNSIPIDDLKMTHFLTKSEFERFKNKNPNRNYKSMGNGDSLADVFRGK
ncbi:TniB family NTP-binding protein [Rheinheimera soli]|uniref:TniB family NTP-binding protein n=1 Tax=Rheinheimera soli TaxID=443616 RepID=UPI001E42C8C0|nr:TniB family NTP-binding protein [Rheinheimera soli]